MEPEPKSAHESGSSRPTAVPRLVATVEDLQVNALAYAPGSGELFASGSAGTFRLRETAERIEGAPGAFHHLLVSPDGSMLFIEGQRWDLREKAVVPFEEPRPRGGYGTPEARFTPDGRHVAMFMRFRPPRGRPVKGKDGSREYRHHGPTRPSGPALYLRIVDTTSGTEELTVEGRQAGFATSNDYIATASLPGKNHTRVRLIELEGATHQLLDAETPKGDRIESVALSDDGSLLAALSTAGRISTWEGPDFEPLAQAASLASDLRGAHLDVHPDGDLLVVSSDGTMGLYRPDTVDAIVEWKANPPTTVTASAFNEDGTRMATAHGHVGAKVHVWAFD